MAPDSFSLAIAVRRQQQADRAKVEPRKKPRKRASKAQALVDFGLADSLAEARAMLRDMSE